MGVDPCVLGIATIYGMRFLEEGQLNGARAMLEILCELTDDDSLKKVLENLPKEE